MTPSRPLSVGLDVHKDSMAVASAAQDHGGAVVALGHFGTRQRDIAPLLRRLPSQSPQLVLVSAAGPCGSWLSRSVTTPGHGGGVVAPSLLPKQAGAKAWR
jgi:transposase